MSASACHQCRLTLTFDYDPGGSAKGIGSVKYVHEVPVLRVPGTDAVDREVDCDVVQLDLQEVLRKAEMKLLR